MRKINIDTGKGTDRTVDPSDHTEEEAWEILTPCRTKKFTTKLGKENVHDSDPFQQPESKPNITALASI